MVVVWIIRRNDNKTLFYCHSVIFIITYSIIKEYHINIENAKYHSDVLLILQKAHQLPLHRATLLVEHNYLLINADWMTGHKNPTSTAYDIACPIVTILTSISCLK